MHLVVQKANGDPQLFDRALRKALASLPAEDPPPDQIAIAPALSKVLRSANEMQKTRGDSYFAVDHVITALAQDSSIQKALSESNISNSNLVQDAVQQIRGMKRIDSKTADAEEDSEYLKKYTIDMISMARNGQIDPVIGREEEMRCLIRILAKRSKNNPLLVGEPGVGKTTVVEGLAQRIVNLDVPDCLVACRLLSLDVNSLAAGAKCSGEFNERLMGVLKGIQMSSERIVLFIDEMHLLMGAGAYNEGSMGAASLLKPMLDRGQLHCIGATSRANTKRTLRKIPPLNVTFNKLLLRNLVSVKQFLF